MQAAVPSELKSHLHLKRSHIISDTIRIMHRLDRVRDLHHPLQCGDCLLVSMHSQQTICKFPGCSFVPSL